MKQIRRINHIFLMINPASGDGQGRQYLTIPQHNLLYEFQNLPITQVHLIDLFDSELYKKAIHDMDLLCRQQYCERLILIVCGGDGTLSWVLNQMIKQGLNLSKILIGILPIGTGNDFSRSIGWGYKPILFNKDSLEQLNLITKKWVTAQIGYYDVWEVQLETYPNGCFYTVKNQVEIKRQNIKIVKTFTNYVGVGLDGRVVYTVEQSRTKNAFLNKVVYACVGFCNCFKSMKTLKETVQTFSQSESQSQFNQNQQSAAQIKNIGLSEEDEVIRIQNSVPFLQEKQNCEVEQKVKMKDINIKKGYRGLVCLNCPSYMAGLHKVWRTGKIGSKSKNNKQFKPQRYNDGAIQFVGYKTQLNLALERIMRSGAKIAQGEGPFEIVMKEAQKGYKQLTFMQIDGESVKVQNLRKIIIRKSKIIQNSQIKVLINPSQ